MTEEITQKKGRGRPRKYPIDTEPKEKRPRGRPRKPVDPEKANLPKRPRGRPRKEGVEKPQIKRPRGRPRKQPIFADVQELNEVKTLSSPRATEIIENNEKLNEPTLNQGIPAKFEDLTADFNSETTQNQDNAKNETIEISAPKTETEKVAVIDFTSEDEDEISASKSASRIALEQKASVFKDKDKSEKLYPAKHVIDEDVQGGMQIAYNKPLIAEQKPNISTPHTPLKTEQPVINKPIYKTAFAGTDKVIVVTGATSGLGFAMARELAGLGQTVIAVGRRPSLCRDARNEILSDYPDAKIYYLVADMSLMSQVRILADEIKKKLAEIGRDCIDVLIHNAGVQTNIHKVTYENHEYMWATNYLSVFLLTHELQPLLDKSKDARVITTTNSKYYKTKLNWADIRGKTEKSNDAVYNQTKLADLMFALEYDHRYSNRNDLHAYCVDPGLVNTELRTKNTRGIKKAFLKHLQNKGKSIEQGIETTIYLAMAEKLPANVVLYSNKKPTEPSKYALDPRNRSALWRYSELELFD